MPTFNHGWLFGGPYTPGSHRPDFPDTDFAPITLPHTVTPLSWGDWDATTWERTWIYRKHFDAPAGQRVFLDFQGVMTNAIVYLDGVEISRHRGGYLPWSVELTRHLTTRHLTTSHLQADNVLAVIVDSTWSQVPPNGHRGGAASVDYLQPGGIYRDVALRVAPDTFIADVFAKPTDVLGASPGIEIEVTIDAASVPSGPARITVELLDGDDQIASATETRPITATGQTGATLTIAGLANVRLWSPDTPKLYEIRTTLTGSQLERHTHHTRTGFRHATFSPDGFYLNGARLQIFGLNRHQLFPYLGMAAPERLQRRDAELLKHELNCNMVRCSHYPQSPYFLDACDELGLMVWEETPGWQYVGGAGFKDIVLENVRDMVIRDRNRPSVVLWGTRLNETKNHPSLYAHTRELANSLDGTRQTTGAMTSQSRSGWTEEVFGYDDYHANRGAATLEQPIPGVPYIVSEAVGALSGAPMYRWIDGQATLALQAQMHAQVHSIAASNPAYAGLLGWAGIDYASLNGGTRIWNHVKWPGVLDTFRVPKPGAAFYRSQIDPSARPVILPVFFWDFGPGSPPGGPGPGTMIATNCDRLELYLGGVHFTTATPDIQDFPGLAHPPVYVNLTVLEVPGLLTLRIDGYVAGQLVTSVHMSADPARDRLALVVDDSSIQADGSDMTRVTFRALDAYGNQRPYPSGDVTLTVTGPGTLIGDNPFPFATYGGVGGAFIRSQAGRTGAVTVSASHPTLGVASGQVAVTPATGRVFP